MKMFLLIPVLFSIVNSVGAYPYLNCNVNDDYTGPLTDWSALCQPMKIVSEYGHAFGLNETRQGDSLAIDRLFSTKESDESFCMGIGVCPPLPH